MLALTLTRRESHKLWHRGRTVAKVAIIKKIQPAHHRIFDDSSFSWMVCKFCPYFLNCCYHLRRPLDMGFVASSVSWLGSNKKEVIVWHKRYKDEVNSDEVIMPLENLWWAKKFVATLPQLSTTRIFLCGSNLFIIITTKLRFLHERYWVKWI